VLVIGPRFAVLTRPRTMGFDADKNPQHDFGGEVKLSAPMR
jgi:hypothetical protein